MFASRYLATLAISLWSVHSALGGVLPGNTGLRLIKTSEADEGSWVTEEDKMDNYVAKGIRFIDITDIKDRDVLSMLSTVPSDTESVQAVQYPTSLSHQKEANSFISDATTTGPKAWLKTMTDFYNRYYRSSYGTESAEWLFGLVSNISSSNPQIIVTKLANSFSQPNIIARIPGDSSDLVIVGAHFDSTGGSSTARGPGADDNGSGVVVLLETLRVLAQGGFGRPANTVEFHFYAGEEGGLLGSQTVFSSYKSSGKTVLAFVNQDMAGYSPSGKVSVYTDYVDSSLTPYVKLIATGYSGAGAPTTDTCGYACSDHQSARANGFPASYVCDEPIRTADPYIHSSRDSYDTIMWDAVLRHTKFTIGFIVEASYL